MKLRYFFFVLIAIVSLSACDETSESVDESNSDLSGESSSESNQASDDDILFSEVCGIDDTSENMVMRQIYTSVPSSELIGLHCLAYTVEQGELLIDIFNFWGNCFGPYGGGIAVEGNTIRASISQLDCSDRAKCSCPYNFSFPVTDIDTDNDIQFEIIDVPCDEEDKPNITTATLPLTTENTGMACLYDGYDEGVSKGVCDPDAAEGDERSCPEDMICLEGPGYYGADRHVCHATCQETADCVPDEAFECVDGICRIANPLVRAQ